MPRPYALDMYRNLYRRQNDALVRLAKAVHLFHHGGPWTPEDARDWEALTGSKDATSRTLCDFAERLLLEPRDP